MLSPNDINRLENDVHPIYADAGILELTGLSYDQFAKDPQRALAQAGQADAPDLIARGFKPLLPAQARIRARLDAEGAEERKASQNASPARSNVVRLHNATGRGRSA